MKTTPAPSGVKVPRARRVWLPSLGWQPPHLPPTSGSGLSEAHPAHPRQIKTTRFETCNVIRYMFFLGSNGGVPFMVRGPGIKPNTFCDVPVITWDLLLTVAEITRCRGTLHSDTSPRSDKPKSGRIAVKVINHQSRCHHLQLSRPRHAADERLGAGWGRRCDWPAHDRPPDARGPEFLVGQADRHHPRLARKFPA